MKEHTRIVFQVDGRELWFDFPHRYTGLLSPEVCDAGLVAMLLPATMRGEDIKVDGSISSKLLFGIENYVLPILAQFLQAARTPKVECESLVKLKPEGTGVVCGFSGGVDSFCSWHEHSGQRVSEEFRITHFVFNNVGHHRLTEAGRKEFELRLDRVSEFARSVDIPLIPVQSNLDDHISLTFQESHVLRNVTVPLLMQNGIGKFLYSSGLPFAAMKIGPSKDMARVENMILPFCSTERTECISVGGRHTRIGKTILVSNVPESRKYLDVCTRTYLAKPGQVNCSICYKCMRTQLTLDVLGKLGDYELAFNLKEYAKFRKLYLLEVLSSSETLTREVFELVRERGYRVSLRIKMLSWLIPSALAYRISRAFPRVRKQKFLLRLANLIL